MTDGIDLAGVIVLVVLVACVILGAVALGYFLGRDRSRPQSDASWALGKEPAPEPEYEDADLPALKVDPENPPTWKIYRGRGGPKCNCHDAPIQQGENILMWPDPEEPGAYRLFHEGFVKGLVPDA